MSKPNFVYVTYIAATPEKVWEALTEAEFTRQYFGGFAIELEKRNGGAFRMLAGDGRLGPWGLYPAIVIMCREILVSGLREFLAELRIGLPVTRLAKWKTTAQMGALGFLIAGDPTAKLLHIGWLHVWLIGTVLLWVSALLTIVTGWDYLVAGLRHAEAAAGAKRGDKREAKPVPPASNISLP